MHRMPVFPDRPGLLVFAHRGLHTKQRENTVAAFQAAVDAGADGIELDVHLTKDGSLAVIHDFNTKRTTGTDAVVEESTFEALKQIDPEIPSLDEVLEHFGDSILYDIEIKCPLLRRSAVEKVLWETIEKHGLRRNIMVSSFDPFACFTFQRISGSAVPVALIYDIDPGIPKVARKGAGRLIFKPSALKPGMNIADHDIRKRKLPISVWCADTEAEARHYASMGARILITNRTDIVRDTVRDMRQQPSRSE